MASSARPNSIGAAVAFGSTAALACGYCVSKDGMALMWMPAHTTVPPLRVAARAFAPTAPGCSGWVWLSFAAGSGLGWCRLSIDPVEVGQVLRDLCAAQALVGHGDVVVFLEHGLGVRIGLQHLVG